MTKTSVLIQKRKVRQDITISLSKENILPTKATKETLKILQDPVRKSFKRLFLYNSKRMFDLY